MAPEAPQASALPRRLVARGLPLAPADVRRALGGCGPGLRPSVGERPASPEGPGGWGAPIEMDETI